MLIDRIVKKLRFIWGTILNNQARRLYEKDPILAANSVFKRVYHRPLDLLHPKHLVEKITWLQLNTDTSLWTMCADKLRMRNYVEQCGLGEFLPKLYGFWETVEEVDISNLPNEFVLKANNGCGTVMIIRDKSKLNLKELQIVLREWLSRPFGYQACQPHYLRIKPCILAEEFLPITGVQAKFSPSSLMDYKIWCFHGIPENCFLAYNRGDGSKALTIDLYDTQWNRLDDKIISNRHYQLKKDVVVPKPVSWKQMLQIAVALSKPFPEVRVDLYEINGRPYIGELTFSSGYGYFTEDYYNYLGAKIDLSKEKRIT